MSGIKMINKEAFKKEINKNIKIYEQALEFRLNAYIAKLVNHAKANGEYEDQTANLRSSIGGVLLKDGRVINKKGFEGKAEGRDEGLSYLDEIIADFGKGYAIVVVAGMEYGYYVETFFNKNVLKKTELKMQVELPVLMQKLKKKLETNASKK